MEIEDKIVKDITGIRNYTLLCVDDSKLQLAKYKVDLEKTYNIHCAENYEETLAIISRIMPDLILLDVNLDGISGLQILTVISGNLSYSGIPVIIVSGCDKVEIVKEAFLKGASDFVRKPYDTDELRLRINNQIVQIEKNRSFENYREEISVKISENTARLREAKNTTVYALTELAESRDNETGSHLKRIKKYVLHICEALAVCSRHSQIMTDEYIDNMYNMSALHDIGKVGISDSILKKQGKLTTEEFSEMKKHTTLGGRILRKAYENNNDSEYLITAIEIAMFHHEKWRGHGYPEGLKEEGIPLSARIVTIADVFDALCTRRVYKEAYEKEKVLSIMKSERGVTFDPYLYDVFMEIKDKLFEVTKLFSAVES